MTVEVTQAIEEHAPPAHQRERCRLPPVGEIACETEQRATVAIDRAQPLDRDAVAGLLAQQSEPALGEPERRVKPVRDHERLRDGGDERIAPTDVRKLVHERVLDRLVVGVMQGRRQQNARSGRADDGRAAHAVAGQEGR